MKNRRNFLLPVAALAALTLSVAAPAAPGSTEASRAATSRAGASPAKVKVSACVSGAMYSDRQLKFRSSMRSIGAGGSMRMRVVIQRRYLEQKHWQVVTPSGNSQDLLPEWLENSNPAATTFVYNFSFVPVETRAQYRVKTFYRWLDASGNIVKRARRASSVCVQTRKLPDLGIVTRRQYANSGSSFPQMPAIHTLTIKNFGSSSASSFSVAGDVNGVALLSDPVTTPTVFDFVPVKTSVDFVFYGPECRSGDKITFTVNPDRSVRESNYDNGSIAESCTG
ncbi:MAG: hypothetical protein HY827_09990 [Actinobacteria bacterium]|nr:hypothetical protein [Actinomycetota bacterium]